MDPRLRPLATLDPRAVPLPHGTEVGTRVDRVVGDRIVPQGAVGRVVKLEGDRVHVQVVGVGVLVYARDEIAPRRAGQMKYAHRREEAWASLHACIVLRTRVGSHAWGLAEAHSDVDERGVFVLPFAWTSGLLEPPLDLVSGDGSSTYWEIGKAIRQGLRADPNTLEALFVPGVEALRDQARRGAAPRSARARGGALGRSGSRPHQDLASAAARRAARRSRAATSSARNRPTCSARRAGSVRRRCARAARGALGGAVKGYEALTDAQTNATRALLAEESAQRTHVVVYLSGAHAYGFER